MFQAKEVQACLRATTAADPPSEEPPPGRNMLRAVTGGFSTLDRNTLEQLLQLQAA